MLLLKTEQHHQWAHHTAAKLHDKTQRVTEMRNIPHNSVYVTRSCEIHNPAFNIIMESDLFAVQEGWSGEATEDKERFVLLVHL